MSNFLKNLVGIVTVEETATDITMGGNKLPSLARDVGKYWASSKVAQYLFQELSPRKMRFDRFFAPDVAYVLKTLTKAKGMYSSPKVLEAAFATLMTETWLANTQLDPATKLDRSKLHLFKKTPLPHQDEFFDIYDKRTQRFNLRGYLLSAAAGSGKTLTILMLAEMRHADTVVLIVPKNSVHKVWSHTLTTEYNQPQVHWIAGEDKPYNGERFLVAHYEALPKLMEILGKLRGKVFVGLDESHNLNEMNTQRSQLFVDLCKRVGSEDIIWSSGTPVKAMGYETIPLMRTIDPLFTLAVEERYKKIFGRTASRALDILQHRMGMVSFRVEKQGVVDNNAKTIERPIRIPNGDDYTLETVSQEMRDFVAERLKHYQDNRKEYRGKYEAGLKTFEATLTTSKERDQLKTYRRYISLISEGYDPLMHKEEAKFCNLYELKTILPTLKQPQRDEFKHARSVVKYVHLKVMGEALGSVLGRKRAQCHLDMLPQMELEKIVEGSLKKTVIFTSFVSVAKATHDLMRAKGFHPIVVYGDTNSQLTSMITSFERDAKANPIVATYQSLSTAVPLIAANTAIFLNAPFRDHERTQARARIDRLGQDSDVFFYEMYLDTGKDRPNISTRSKDILEWSKEQIAAIMGSEHGIKVDQLLDQAFVSTESLDDDLDVALESYHESLPGSMRW